MEGKPTGLELEGHVGSCRKKRFNEGGDARFLNDEARRVVVNDQFGAKVRPERALATIKTDDLDAGAVHMPRANDP